VPAGRAIFFPIINAECSTLEPEPFACSDEASCSGCAAGFVDATAGLACEIDGVPVTDLESYRVQSPLFTIGPLTEDNLLGLPEGTTGESVSDGVWVMVAPLSVGEHTIHFAGTFVDFDLTLDVTYHLTIVP
jgi:hypothetical protein